ncbi:AAA family ATPase [Micrococcus luteus]|uniref:AAA family ATPase n=1 Tax=Micrococcus TaxID=1269 RepID=UPI001FFBBCB7|nr:AAA family ATPase [Micrococcus sp. XM4230A]MCV7452638.1 AAA family ATPase [Micrococcus luteus]MCK1812563.1 AAA family ATPase [Micrococcus sp. XM4230A]MCV7518696.1 AAA family ATPase [Micrococcus luteus]MCV7569619.1 AAA family ATPase [Micrococcus luteus]MCV7620771.1 AAA family ATPase [Micrococcus luteus]
MSFRVQRYKNVLDSTEVSVEGDVTALVGMNESGKSTMLDALYRLNPVYGDKFVELDDYPRWRRSRDSRSENLQEVTPIEATFKLDSEDISALAAKLGEGVVSSDTVRVGRCYDGEVWVELAIDEKRFLRDVLEGHRDADELLGSQDTVEGLREALDVKAKDEAESATAAAIATGNSDGTEDELAEVADEAVGATAADVLSRIAARLGATADIAAAAEDIVIARMPKFFLFSDYQRLEGRVDVAELKTQMDEHPGASPKQTARALLKLANTDVDAMTDSSFEASTAELESVSNDLSREMKKYWSTNPELRIKIVTQPETIVDARGQHSVVRFLNFRVEDRKHDFTNNFSRRSSGYQWFFSFLAAFSEFESRGGDVVILLDEPGLTLHAKAQRDFLRFINERLAPAGQVLYTTHSPFMVEQIERVRVVEDRGEDIGSVTSSDALEVGEDSAFPLQAALGYDLTQNLFIGERNLLVEGPSDLAYLDLVSRRLRELGREGVDERWRILPAGGSSNLPAFVSLLGRKVSVTVLLDSGTEGGGRVEAAVNANKIDNERIVLVSTVLGQKHADIEDLFTEGDYVELYNAAFDKSIRAEALPNHPERILKRLEELGEPKFDHWRPAAVLLRDPSRVERLSEATLANFEALAKRINATHV